MAEEEKKTPEGQQSEQPEQQAQPTRPAPITNPKLLEAIAQFKSETNRVNEIKFLQEMLNARYLVPVIMETPPNETMKPGERVSTRVAFQMLTNDKNEKFIPAFTDQDELVKNTVQPRHQVAVLTVRDFAMVFSQNPICKGFVINPFGDNMCLTREQLENLFQHARQVPRQQGQQDGKVLVGGAPSLSSQVDMAMNNLKKEKEMEAYIRAAKETEARKAAEAEESEDKPKIQQTVNPVSAAEKPQELIDALSRYLKKQKGVKRAYLQLMLGEQPHYLIAVECDDDRAAVFAAIKAEAGTYTDLAVKVVDVASDSAKDLVSGEKPFYEKKRFGLFS